MNSTQNSTFLEINLKIRTLLETAYEKAAESGSSYKNYERLFSAIHEITIILNEIYGYFNKLNLEISEPFFLALQEANFGNLKIISRLLDNNFYLGIIGEFSCGKSTFINAYLEQQSLIEDVLPGTTCSVTKIKYADYENLAAYFNDGSKQSLRKASNKDIFLPEPDKHKFLELMTATEEKARNIREVIWEAPIKSLAGICLIDTPGLGSLNERHTAITGKIAKECDGLIVLSNLDKPLSRELITNIKEIIDYDGRLQENAEKLFFVGTKKDLLPKKELPRMTSHFAKRLNECFGPGCSFTFLSAYQALHNGNAYYQEFCEFRNDMRERLRQKRAWLQIKNTASLLAGTIQKISLEFKQQQKDFAAKTDSWQNEIGILPPVFWEESNRKLCVKYSSAAHNIYINARAKTDELVNRLQMEIKNGLYACSSTDAIQKFLKDELYYIRVDYTGKLNKLPETALAEPFIQTVAQLQSDFLGMIQSEFNKADTLFSSLKPMGTELNPKEKRRQNVLLDYIGMAADGMEYQKYKIMGSGFAGLIATSLLLPGIGLLFASIGGCFSALMAMFFSKSLERWKDEIYEEAIKKVQIFKNNLHENLHKEYSKIGQRCADCLENFISSCHARYEEILETHNRDIAERQNSLNEASIFFNKKIERLNKIGDELNNLTIKYKN